jgi:polysaccharide pyruvyl transferase
MGSYVGQDSFGDKCLLRCVVAQFRNVFGADVRAVSDVQENCEEAVRIIPEALFIVRISQLFSDWLNRLRHLHLPYSLQMAVACLTFPLWLLMTAKNRDAAADILRETKACKCLYFYGGTQLSQQWFTMNFPPLFFMLVLCRVLGKPVYLGPQQYGPEKAWQQRCLRWVIKLLVTDIRARNENCIRMLALPESKLFYDEVFSCVVRYPLRPTHTRQPTFILINMRASNFIRDATDAEFRAFAGILQALYERLHLPFKLFQMSGSSFCDDQGLKSFLDRNGFDKLPVEILPPLDQEQNFIELASRAYGTVSMSFHGCILSMIGGCPAVPITSEKYYDYKYVDFDRYTGGQGVPVPSLQNHNDADSADSIVNYFARYQPAVTAATRERAAAQIKQWYQRICDDSSADASVEANA